ncbi:uncharacterized protein LOC111324366 isoform X1 [Stylophora pistillata]|uniref:uncharacterized protein LOC111324366 isoform X1 n=1 Tax=Stylophora pistillata TaxID=50429 RepID=UPI000C03E301|nr:uncharacterized protein LOC111324366 isoform X1 [Stylophora pistillata]
MLRWTNLSLNSVNFSQGDVCKMDDRRGQHFHFSLVRVLRGVDAYAETKEKEKEERENPENQDVLYEAKVMETQRVLDDEEITVYNSKPTRRNEDLTVVNPFTCIEEGVNE